MGFLFMGTSPNSTLHSKVPPMSFAKTIEDTLPQRNAHYLRRCLINLPAETLFAPSVVKPVKIEGFNTLVINASGGSHPF